jgi:D-alanyl-D-alanine carboxypeptidase/D-alanyl-D-alanine-endopeptidase (penicillin-binding protein 4)
VLQGSVFIKGSGDPKLVLERLWLMLRRLQQMGVRDIRGDIVLDNSAWAVPEVPAGDFDGEALRPYNVRPAALLFNFRSVIHSFVPDPAAGVARVAVEPPLAGTVVDLAVPLVGGPCGDWRAALKASFEPGRTRFAGHYAASCGEMAWSVADPLPATYEARCSKPCGARWAVCSTAACAKARRRRTRSRLSRCLHWPCPRSCATSTSSATT